MARPSVDPDWAETLAADPVSGQNNRVEPPASWKADGWSYQEKPPRNYDNYVKWNLGQWIKYLDQVGVRPATYFVAASDADAETKRHADAVCDGTDDHVEINAAVDAIAATGGLVLLSEGTFTVNGSVLSDQDNVAIRGTGSGSTEIIVDAAASADFDIVDVTGDNTGLADLAVNGNSGSVTQVQTGIKVSSLAVCRIERCAVSSVAANVTGGTGISIINSADLVWITNCTVASCDGVGVATQNGADHVIITGCRVSNSGGAGYSIGSDDTRLVSCHAENSTDEGFHLFGLGILAVACTAGSGSDTGFRVTANSVSLTQCVAKFHSTGNGFLLEADGARLSGCYAASNVDGFGVWGDGNSLSTCNAAGNGVAGFRMTDAENALLTGCVSAANSQHGMSIDGTTVDCSICNCAIHSNSQLAADTYNGIEFASASSDRNTVCNNKVRAGTLTNKQQYGIGGTGLQSANSNYVYNNDLVGGGNVAALQPGSQSKTIPQYVWDGSAHQADSIADSNRIA